MPEIAIPNAGRVSIPTANDEFLTLVWVNDHQRPGHEVLKENGRVLANILKRVTCSTTFLAMMDELKNGKDNPKINPDLLIESNSLEGLLDDNEGDLENNEVEDWGEEGVTLDSFKKKRGIT